MHACEHACGAGGFPEDLVSRENFRTGKTFLLLHKHLSGVRNASRLGPTTDLGVDQGEPPNIRPAPTHHTNADELNVGVVRAKGVGGCASEEGIILGCRHIGNGQETAMDSTLVVCVFSVPGEKGHAQRGELGLEYHLVGPGLGSPGILEIQRDSIFGPSENNVGNTTGTAVEGGRTGAVPSCSHFG